MARIELKRLSKTYPGGHQALEAIELDIASGELLVVLGPSGSGKSTLLRTIAGLEAPTSGSVWVDGKDVTALAPHQRDAAMVFQVPATYPHLSVFDNLAFGLRARGHLTASSRSTVNTTAGLLGLDGLLSRRPDALSGGERQRVAIGRAIARRPRVLLFDEPFSNLDPPLRAALREEVVDLQRRFGSTLILVTHDQAEALVMGDRVAVLDRGRLLQCGPPRTIYQRPNHRFVGEFLGSPPMNVLPCEIRREGDRLRAYPIAADHALSWTMPAGALPEGTEQAVLGLRPEAVRVCEVSPSAEPDSPRGPSLSSQPTLPAQVRRLVFNGAEVLATLALGPHRLVARLPANATISERARAHVVLDLEQAVWFDPKTGEALAMGRSVAARDRQARSAN